MCATAGIMSTNTRAAPEMAEIDINGLMMGKIKNGSGISPNHIWAHMNTCHRSTVWRQLRTASVASISILLINMGGEESPVIFVI